VEIYKIISETEKALKVKYPYYHVYCGKVLRQQYKTLWLPKVVANKSIDVINKFVADKIDADVKKLPLNIQREVNAWYVGIAPNNK
jgi:hypothetical protein